MEPIQAMVKALKILLAAVLLFLQVMIFYLFLPHGGWIIGLVSLILDLTAYCLVVSGALKPSRPPAKQHANR